MVWEIFSKRNLAIAGVLIIVVALSFFSVRAYRSGSGLEAFTGAAVAEPLDYTGATQGTNEIQKVTLSLQNFQYVLEPSTLKVGVPVEMTVDLSTVTGCTRTIVIPDFNVRAQVSEGKNVISFTPTKTGTIQMSCGMGMARGSFTVTQEGTAQALTQGSQVQNTAIQAPSSQAQASCSMDTGASGGCGCGMIG